MRLLLLRLELQRAAVNLTAGLGVSVAAKSYTTYFPPYMAYNIRPNLWLICRVDQDTGVPAIWMDEPCGACPCDLAAGRYL